MGPLSDTPGPIRCFVTAVVVDKPEWNRFVSTVHWKQDHGGQSNIGLSGSFSTPNGNLYRVGDVVNVTVAVEGGFK